MDDRDSRIPSRWSTGDATRTLSRLVVGRGFGVERLTGQRLEAPITQKPENLQVIVCGGPGKHSCWMPTFGGDTRPVMRKLER